MFFQNVTFLPDRVKVVQAAAQSLRAEGLMTHAMACVSQAFLSPMQAKIMGMLMSSDQGTLVVVMWCFNRSPTDLKNPLLWGIACKELS